MFEILQNKKLENKNQWNMGKGDILYQNIHSRVDLAFFKKKKIISFMLIMITENIMWSNKLEKHYI